MMAQKEVPMMASWWLPGGFLGLPRKESEQRGLSDMYVQGGYSITVL